MKRALISIIATAAMLVPAVASAAPPTVNGSFVEAFKKSGQAHRAYFKVTAGQGSKTCEVTLRGRTIEVDLGTDQVSALSHIWYLHPQNATKAVAQAKAAPSPTGLIVCGH
jgi:hypothetical protein